MVQSRVAFPVPFLLRILSEPNVQILQQVFMENVLLTCVCSSVPVTMFPTALNVGVYTRSKSLTQWKATLLYS